MTTPQTLLRTATLEDLNLITDLHTQARTTYYRAGGLPEADLVSPEARSRRREAWKGAIQAETRSVLCALRDGKLVGILSMGPPTDVDLDPTTVGQLHQIHVHPGCWGQGIGSQLHRGFVQFLRSASLTTGVLEAWGRNSRAQAFYARHGWVPDGHHRPGPGNAHYIRMCRFLAPSTDTALPLGNPALPSRQGP